MQRVPAASAAQRTIRRRRRTIHGHILSLPENCGHGLSHRFAPCRRPFNVLTMPIMWRVVRCPKRVSAAKRRWNNWTTKRSNRCESHANWDVKCWTKRPKRLRSVWPPMKSIELSMRHASNSIVIRAHWIIIIFRLHVVHRWMRSFVMAFRTSGRLRW